MSTSGAAKQLAPWVLVCGGFHRFGGMDRANLALAETLLAQGRTVYLVSHNIDPELGSHPNAKPIMVPRPLDSILLGERALQCKGFETAQAVRRHFPDARIVVNGGNCDFPDINWVHSVHHAWPRLDDEAPLWFRAKSALNKAKAMRDEERALLQAKLVIANSERTRRDLISMGIQSDKISTIYLGSEAIWTPASPEQKRQARRTFAIPEDALLICFVGALGYDRNKGFDTLLRAWKQIEASNVFLIAAGGGRGWEKWQTQVRQSRMADRIRLLGFTDRVNHVFDAADLMVSPVRYEAYGMNVHEAICRGIPSIVSASAGVAELYARELHAYLLCDPESVTAVGDLLKLMIANLDCARRQFSQFGDQLRSRTWKQMAEEIIALAEVHAAKPPQSRG